MVAQVDFRNFVAITEWVVATLALFQTMNAVNTVNEFMLIIVIVREQ